MQQDKQAAVSRQASVPDRGRLRILVFLDSDRTVANFLRTGAFLDLCDRNDVLFVTPPRSKRFSLDPRELFEPGAMIALPTVDERVANWLRMAMIDQLAWRPGAHWRKMRRMRRMAMGRRERTIMSIAALPGISMLTKAWIGRQLARTPFSDLDSLLAERKPDVVIYPTAFNGPFANDLAISARRLGIRSVFLMNSWDNPSTKNLLSELPDWIGVWGEQTASHAVEYMGVSRERIAILGAPQLESLQLAPRVDSRAAKLALGLDPDRPTLLFGESTMYENTLDHLAEFDTWCGKQPDPKPQILYRTYPFRTDKGPEEAFSRTWSNVVLQDMSSYQREQTAGALDAIQHGKLLALYAADAVISKLSTILIEAMLLGKSLLCIVPTGDDSIFSPRNAPLSHFKEILAHPDVVVTSDQDDVGPALDRLMATLGGPAARDRLKATADEILAPLPGNYSRRLADFADAVCGGDERACGSVE